MSGAADAARVQQIVDAALPLSVEERGPLLDELCRGDEVLLAEVLAQLELESATTRQLGADVGIPDSSPFSTRRIGEYRLLQEIGTGGMGSVWEAERVDSYRQRVAIKILRGWMREQDRARFEQERQILASLEHAGIARLYDGGSTESGIPYLVMELVDGQRIDDYCSERELGHREIVSLIVEVARAVEYAHEKGVVHRDLKPSNILVNDRGEPHLLDFGISKILGSEGEELTTPDQRIHTPRYASPEQIDGLEVTPATDVHALGILLFELLTRTWPFGADDSTRTSVENSVLRVSAVAPSSVARSTDLPIEESGTRSRDTVRRWWSRSRDLDTIVLQALRKEPERRYPNAREFRLDLERFLDGDPISARGDSSGYRARKFLVRHAGLLVTAVAVLIAIAATWLAVTRSAPEIAFDLRVTGIAKGRVELRWQGSGIPAGARVRVIPDQGEPIDLPDGETLAALTGLDLTPHVATAELYREGEPNEVLARARCEFDLSPRVPVLVTSQWRGVQDATFDRWGEHRFVDPVFADGDTLLLASHPLEVENPLTGIYQWRWDQPQPTRVVEVPYPIAGLGFDRASGTFLTARRGAERIDRWSSQSDRVHSPETPVTFRGDRVVARGMRCAPEWYGGDLVEQGEAVVAGRRGTVWVVPVEGDLPSRRLFPKGEETSRQEFSDVECGRVEVYLSDPRPPRLGGGLFRLTADGLEVIETSETLSPRGLAWDPVRDQLLVASSGNLSQGRVVSVDPQTGEVETLVELPNALPGYCWNGVAVSPDGRLLAVVDLRGVSFFERAAPEGGSGAGAELPNPGVPSQDETLNATSPKPEVPTGN